MLDFFSTRRDVLKTGGALFVTFTLAGKVLPALAQGSAQNKTVSPYEVDGFLSVDVDGQISVYSGKVDLGTGVRTALTQIVAEELEVPLDRVNLIQGDTALTPDQGPTWGSLSIQIGGMQIRKAAATARKALVEMAAEHLGVSATELRIENGTIKGSGKSVPYAELVGGRTFSLKVDKDAPVKDPASYTIVGKSVPRLDIPPKATGHFMYMQDFRVAGMLHGRVIRPLAIGAKLENVDDSSVNGVPGLVQVVREGNFLGVVATTEWGAIQAARKLKATWSKWEGLPERAHLWEHVRATRINSDEVTSNVGNSAKALSDAPKRSSATYDFAIHTHGSIGPSCAVVEINDGKITCWSASQATHRLKKQLAAMMAIPLDNVRCLYIEGSGCYGRNGHEDAAGDAALLSRLTARERLSRGSRNSSFLMTASDQSRSSRQHSPICQGRLNSSPNLSFVIPQSPTPSQTSRQWHICLTRHRFARLGFGRLVVCRTPSRTSALWTSWLRPSAQTRWTFV